jgi:ABC-type branched-subunit amino acid transport system permease subunit
VSAIRDDSAAASSSGVQVSRHRRLVYLVAAFGCGLAGCMIAAVAIIFTVFLPRGVVGADRPRPPAALPDRLRVAPGRE